MVKLCFTCGYSGIPQKAMGNDNETVEICASCEMVLDA